MRRTKTTSARDRTQTAVLVSRSSTGRLERPGEEDYADLNE